MGYKLIVRSGTVQHPSFELGDDYKDAKSKMLTYLSDSFIHHTEKSPGGDIEVCLVFGTHTLMRLVSDDHIRELTNGGSLSLKEPKAYQLVLNTPFGMLDQPFQFDTKEAAMAAVHAAKNTGYFFQELEKGYCMGVEMTPGIICMVMTLEQHQQQQRSLLEEQLREANKQAAPRIVLPD